MRLSLFILFILFLFQNKNVPEPDDIVRMNKPSVSGAIEKVIPHIIEFNDTIPGDTLFEYDSADKFPVMFSRKIVTGVCIKGECRPVVLDLFWDCTGRYLGFRLPDGEFLSKTEHVKFSNDEYDRLHGILGNRQSALATYTYIDLVTETDTTKNGVDAVTSATMKALLDYIVEGAVYTTYTLWQIVYGQTKREVENITVEKLTSKSTFEILNSEIPEDKIWILNHFPPSMNFTPALLDKLMEYISGKDAYLAERALNALPSAQLSDSIQQQLSEIFETTGQIQKRYILQKLNEVQFLDKVAAIHISAELSKLNTSLVLQVLELLSVKNIDDVQVSDNVAALLEHSNRYISELAFHFLEKNSRLSRKTQRSLEKYKKKRN